MIHVQAPSNDGRRRNRSRRRRRRRFFSPPPTLFAIGTLPRLSPESAVIIPVLPTTASIIPSSAFPAHPPIRRPPTPSVTRRRRPDSASRRRRTTPTRTLDPDRRTLALARTHRHIVARLRLPIPDAADRSIHSRLATVLRPVPASVSRFGPRRRLRAVRSAIAPVSAPRRVRSRQIVRISRLVRSSCASRVRASSVIVEFPPEFKFAILLRTRLKFSLAAPPVARASSYRARTTLTTPPHRPPRVSLANHAPLRRHIVAKSSNRPRHHRPRASRAPARPRARLARVRVAAIRLAQKRSTLSPRARALERRARSRARAPGRRVVPRSTFVDAPRRARDAATSTRGANRAMSTRAPRSRRFARADARATRDARVEFRADAR